MIQEFTAKRKHRSVENYKCNIIIAIYKLGPLVVANLKEVYVFILESRTKAIIRA